MKKVEQNVDLGGTKQQQLQPSTNHNRDPLISFPTQQPHRTQESTRKFVGWHSQSTDTHRLLGDIKHSESCCNTIIPRFTSFVYQHLVFT